MKRTFQSEHERLHAFVDGELDAREKARFLEAMERDASLREQACELRRTKEYVNFAFDDIPPPPRQRRLETTGRRSRWPQALAAALLVAIGFFFGLYTGQGNGAPAVMKAGTAQMPDERVVLHIADADPIKFEEALNDAELLLREHAGRSVQVEVIANSNGIDLLRADVSPFIDRIQELAARHENLTFVACNTTLQRLQRQGENPQLVEGIKVTPSAVEHIINRMQAGWVYLKV